MTMMELHVCNRAGILLRAFALGENKEVIVGRDETCDVRIMAKSVSREHCAIEQDGDDLILRDLGSSGGTYLGQKRVDKVKIQDGMEIGVGPAVLKFFDSGI
ncbi:MAG: FHA domain-containing protein [Phycisphaerales bacterium]|nr:FHA domain-containing protein [Phycisphaerales bacterium]MCI0631360.1 FHA domain-containing protein [Phycisphaerales bacterium]